MKIFNIIIYACLLCFACCFFFSRLSKTIIKFIFNFKEQGWRNPDLEEVIEFLSHPSNEIKANAAAYLQHLCYQDDETKA